MFLRTIAILLVSLPLAAQTVRPNLNGLEMRKGHMIQQAQTEAQISAARAVEQAARSAAEQAAAQKAFSANSDPAKVKALSDALTRANQRAKASTAQQTQAATRVTQLENQMNDWTEKTLKVHSADDGKHGIDWAHGAVVSK